jgi:hypothetical protein
MTYRELQVLDLDTKTGYNVLLSSLCPSFVWVFAVHRARCRSAG